MTIALRFTGSNDGDGGPSSNARFICASTFSRGSDGPPLPSPSAPLVAREGTSVGVGSRPSLSPLPT
eukprot:2975309-Lingulodinium_polyedra.AAC.1